MNDPMSFARDQEMKSLKKKLTAGVYDLYWLYSWGNEIVLDS